MERTDRIEEEIKKVASKVISQELKDPRLTGLISVTKVAVTKDLKYCKIYVSKLGTNNTEETMTALKSGSGVVRKAIGDNIRMHSTPEVIFELDFKEELSEFVYAIEDLIEDRSLEFAEEWFDEESDISEWAKIINYKWSGSGYVLACIDIDSDSYCLFVINNDDYKIIADEANKIGHRIIVLD